MTSAQILKALNRYIASFRANDWSPKRFTAEEANPTRNQAMEHAYWMAIETQDFVDAKPAKAERWLCFIQGVMWSFYGSTIAEFKDDNRGED